MTQCDLTCVQDVNTKIFPFPRLKFSAVELGMKLWNVLQWVFGSTVVPEWQLLRQAGDGL
jgi:hypothetical protein